MKSIKLLLVLSLAVVSGCAESSALIKANSSSMRSDIYQELTSGGIAPQGFSDLRVTASLKTRKPGIFSESEINGTPEYKLLLNIDGQAVLLQGNIQKEKSEPMKMADPEAGDGIRYRFSKNLRLKAGSHRIVVAIPDGGIAVERELYLTEGNVNNLVIEPVYSTVPGKRQLGINSATSYKEGIRTIRLMLNGREA